MWLKKKNYISSLLSILLFFFSGIWSIFAQSNTSTTSTTTPPIWLLILYRICNSQKHKAIGGWLLFYYITLFGSVTFSLIELFSSLGNYDFGSLLYIFAMITQLVFACILLSKKFRNHKFYNYLKITLIITLVVKVIIILIDISSYPDFIRLDTIQTLWWWALLLYFLYSKRVKMVFIDNKRKPEELFPKGSKNYSEPIKWKDKIVNVTISKEEIWTTAEFEGDKIHFPRNKSWL